MLKVEERIECRQSGKVRYTSREDNILSLALPMDAVLNKGTKKWLVRNDDDCDRCIIITVKAKCTNCHLEHVRAGRGPPADNDNADNDGDDNEYECITADYGSNSHDVVSFRAIL